MWLFILFLFFYYLGGNHGLPFPVLILPVPVPIYKDGAKGKKNLHFKHSST